MMDKFFELQGEAAERPEPKKLTAADIPEGYSYAAVDSDGQAYGYLEKPERDNASWVALREDITFLGKDFDATDWRNSLVKRETAERPEPKKLTAADIPKGFNYAAVDSDGRANGYKDLPELFEWQYDSAYDSKVKYLNHKTFIGIGYDCTDWQNSLVSRETAEKNNASLLSVSEFAQLVQEIQKNKKGANEAEAIKDQQDKPSFLEIDPNFLEAMAWRMTANKGKYPVNNWKGLTDRFTILDAIYRHANDIKRMLEGGESLTGETIQKHCAAIACNAQFLFYHSPENQWERAARSRQSNAKEI